MNILKIMGCWLAPKGKRQCPDGQLLGTKEEQSGLEACPKSSNMVGAEMEEEGLPKHGIILSKEQHNSIFLEPPSISFAQLLLYLVFRTIPSTLSEGPF
jgi:hypothetical protein